MSSGRVQFVDRRAVRASCIKCNILLRNLSGRKRKISTKVDCIRFSKLLQQVVSIGDVICNKCRIAAYKCSGREELHEENPTVSTTVPFNSQQTEESSPATLLVAESTVETSSAAASLAGPSSAAASPIVVLPPVAYLSASSSTTAPFDSPSSLKTSLITTDQVTTAIELSVSETSSLQGSSSDINSSSSLLQDPSFELGVNTLHEFTYVEMAFSRVVSTHAYCFVCGSRKGIINVPPETRKQVFIMRRIYVPKGNRCCPGHLLKKRLFQDIVSNLRIHSNTSFIDTNELRNYFEYLAINSDSSIKDKVGDFTLSEERLKAFTGLNWENLIQLREMMTSMRKSEQRDVTQAIVVFLFKLRTGNSNNLVAAILGLDREQQVSNYCNSVLNSFEKDILPFHFGLAAVSREHLVQNECSTIAQRLYNLTDQLALIFDGTYIRHGKSSNNEYQRKSYSGHKKVPLCKPFTICTTNGFIVDILGPFFATQNDAQIMQIVMQDPSGIRNLMKPGDICIVDRGFRDVKSHLEKSGYKVLMPELKGKRSQLTTTESNASRQVTKVRWVVEAIHGIIGQKYRLLHHQMDNKLLPKVQLYCKIACFLNNTFGKRLNSDEGIQDEIVNRMISQNMAKNSLAIEVKSQRWSRRKIPFKKVLATDLLDFPEMTEKDLKILFTGSYQLSQAISYLAEIMDEDNNINVLCLKDANNIVRFEVRSRHVNSKSYRCYIHYKPNSIGFSAIERYCCECANGNRTIGCCSHVAAIIYYLSHARYLSTIVRPAEILCKIFDKENVIPVINEDSDED